MKRIYQLLAGIVLIANCLGVSAQTDTARSATAAPSINTLADSSAKVLRKDSIRADIRAAQLPKVKKYRTWDIGAHVGLMFPNTDIAAEPLDGDILGDRLGYGLHVTKFLSHSFALKGQFLRGGLTGEGGNGANEKYSYQTDIDYEFSLNALFQFGNIAFLKRDPNLSIYGSLGVGLINFTPTVMKDGFEGENNYYVQDNLLDTTVDYSNSSEAVFPFSLGIKYRVAKAVSLNLEYSLHVMNNDKLDGWYRLLSENDNFSYVNLGVSVHLGSQDEVAEWVNPMQSIYTDIYDMKDRIDLLTDDTDQDGVADMFDREPNTPLGAKVYGDGTSVDADGDGVPDVLDVQPFTAKGAKVDAQGREIDTDGDGIGDFEDLEPGTPKGTLVNVQGIAIPTPNNNRNQKGGVSTVSMGGGYIPSIFFDFNSTAIDPKYDPSMASIAMILKNNPDLKLEIIGHTDTKASADYNNKLGLRRAESVKKELVEEYSIDPSRLTTKTSGKEATIARKGSMNRRVEFKVVE